MRSTFPFCIPLFVFVSCAPRGFADPTIVSSVRILASRADAPYAAPGANVNVSLLAYDGRASKPEPMTIWWAPRPCINPRDDLYYACFDRLAAGDVSSGLGTGLAASLAIPPDIVDTHPAVAGARHKYGLAILFNAACAGHLQLIPVDPNDPNPQKLPVGCFDASGNQLGPDDFVFGFTRVYAYAPDSGVTNANPVIDHVEVQGQAVDLAMGLTTARCTAKRREDCAHVRVGVSVPASSQEDNPDDTDDSGRARKEEIWADYYATFGDFTSEARLLYDTTAGAVQDSDNEFLPPADPGEGSVWIVVHDNRGGASWAQVSVHVQ